MTRRWLAAAGVMCLCCGAHSAQATGSKNTLEVLSLEIHKPLPPERKELQTAFQEGTSLRLLCTLPGKKIIGVDDEASKLTHFSDDKKTDLSKSKTAKGGNRFADRWLSGFMTRISQDGQSCSVAVRGPAVPAPGASRILLKATLVVQCGQGDKMVEQKGLTWKLDSGVDLGPFKVAMKKSFSSDAGMMFSVSSQQPDLKAFRVFDKNGAEVKTQSAGRGRSSVFGKTNYQTSFLVDKKLDGFTLRIDYYTKIETVTVPVDLQVGVGF